MAKIALNAARLSKFEADNGKSWSPRKMVEKIYGSLQCWRDFAHAQRAVRVFFSAGPYTILANNSICLDRSAIMLYSGWQIRVADFKYAGKIRPYAQVT